MMNLIAKSTTQTDKAPVQASSHEDHLKLCIQKDFLQLIFKAAEAQYSSYVWQVLPMACIPLTLDRCGLHVCTSIDIPSMPQSVPLHPAFETAGNSSGESTSCHQPKVGAKNF